MRTISKVWRNLYPSLGQVDPKNPLENALIKQTMTPWKYKKQAEIITKRGRIKARDSILEIGGGYGGLAQEILKIIPVSYTIVENKVMLIQAKKFLGDKVEYIEAGKIEALRERKFTMFISFHCLSETPPEYRRYILENIIKNCRKIAILDLRDTVRPTPKMLEDGYEMLPMNIGIWLEKYFVIKQHDCRYNNINYNGVRKKENWQ